MRVGACTITAGVCTQDYNASRDHMIIPGEPRHPPHHGHGRTVVAASSKAPPSSTETADIRLHQQDSHHHALVDLLLVLYRAVAGVSWSPRLRKCHLPPCFSTGRKDKLLIYHSTWWIGSRQRYEHPLCRDLVCVTGTHYSCVLCSL